MDQDDIKKIEKKTKKKFKSKIIKFVLALVAIAAAVAAVAKFIDNILEKKRQAKNEDSDIKEYSGLFKSIAVNLKDFGLSGIISKTCFSAVNLDLSEATFKQDAFISLNANFSAVVITIPEGYSVSFDGLFNKCAVRNAFEGEEIKDPVIYIAAKANYSAIRIVKK
ncbi:MAG: hypothetical protein K6E85_15845 [Lachnospiraceae bacterium]|nr:hypothetical protein [Lachnospiraceae bacterium]